MDPIRLFEDEHLLVVDKPPGMVVNRAASVKTPTLQDWAEEYLKFPTANIPWGDDFFSRAGIAHRIDKETSGIVLIGKNAEVFAGLLKQFQERTIEKTYVAIAHGDIRPTEGRIVAPVGRLPWNRERFGVVIEGKEAETVYMVRRSFLMPENGKEPLSVVELFPHTGRTHQIRVHLQYIKHPILGDFLYAGRKVSAHDRRWVPRVMLHARKIRLMHPITHEALVFEAPIPEDMLRCMGGSL